MVEFVIQGPIGALTVTMCMHEQSENSLVKIRLQPFFTGKIYNLRPIVAYIL